MIEVDLGDGVIFTLEPPPDARALGSEQLPAIDLRKVPGGELAAQRAYVGTAETLSLYCARASSSYWAPGLETLALEQATAVARAHLPAMERWTSDPIQRGPGWREQLVHGSAEQRSVILRHVLGFVGDEHRVLLCTVTCQGQADPSACASLLAKAAPRGAFVAEPPPSPWVAAALWSANSPREATLMVGLFALGVVALLLWRRPRPRL